MIEELWAFAVAAYLDSPLPSLFKERLFVHLSRFCEVRYCVIRHVGFLVGEGRPAGDPEATPATVAQALALLRRPVPDATALDEVYRRLEAQPASAAAPLPETQDEADLFDALTVIFLSPTRSARARQVVRRFAGDRQFEILAAFLAFVHTAHYWTETHPEVECEADMAALMAAHPELTAALMNTNDARFATASEELRQTLRESEELRRIAIEGGGMGTWRWNLRDDLIWGDAAFLSLWGYPPSDKSRPLSDFAARMSPQGQVEMGEMVARANEAGEAFDGQLAVVSGPTKGHWVRWRGRAQQERPWLINGVSFDVTDQRARDDQLRDSEQRFRALATTGAFSIYRMSPDWRLMYQLDGGTLATTANPIEDWVEKYIPDGDLPAVRYAIEHAIRTRSMFELEHRVRLADGGIGWVLSRAVPLLDAQGEIVEWFGAGSDVTARREAVEALRESEARFQALFAASPVPFMVLAPNSPDFTITAANEAYFAATLTTPDTLIGSRLFDVFTDDPRRPGQLGSEALGISLDRVLATKRTDAMARVRYDLVTPKGFEQHWWEATNAPLLDADGKVTAIIHQVARQTELHYAEEAKRESEERQAFLLKLSDTLRPLASAVDIMTAASEALGRHLNVGRCAYCELDETGDYFTVEHDWTDGVMHSSVGRHFFGFGDRFREDYRAGKTVLIDDALADARATGEEAAFETAGGVRASIGVPLIKDGRFAAGFFVQQLKPRHWTAQEASLTREVAERTWAALERARAEAAMRQSEEKYRSLFETMGQGYVEVELVRDREARAVDFTYLELNPAFERLFGIPADEARGRRGGEVFPGLEGYWHDAYDRILRTGAPERLEFPVASLGRWFEAFAYPQAGDRLTLLYEDITERKQAEAVLRESEERQAFLLKLSDALRPLTDALEIQSAAAGLVGRHLRASRTIYALVHGEPGAEQLHLTGQYVTVGEPMPQWVDAQAFGSALVDAMLQGEWIGITDAATDPRIPDADREAHLSAKIASYGCVSLLKHGRAVAVLSVHSDVPREWTASEAALLSEVADRTWDAVERARAEAALRESEQTLAADLAGTSLLRDLAERLVTEENLATIHGEILAAAIAIMQADAGTVQVYEPETTSLVLLATSGLEPAMTEHFHRVDAASTTGCGMALREGRRVFIDFDQAEGDDAGRRHIEAGLHTAQATPLVSRDGAPLGMLNTHWRASGYRATERELRFLDLLARQAADLIERAQAQWRLRESEERLRQFGEASQDVLWIRDAETLQWTYLTPAFEPIYGLSREDALNGDSYRSWLELVVAEDRVQAMESIEKVRAGEQVAFEFRIRRPVDGAIRWMRNTDFPIADGRGKVALIGGIGSDITELREAEQRLHLLIGGIPQLVWRALSDGRWTWASPQWTEFTGQEEADSHDQGWLDVVHPDDRERTREVWADAVERAEFRADYRVRHAGEDRYRWFQTRATPVCDASGTIIEWLGTLTDVDELRGLQERQAVLVAELQHRTRNLMAVVRSTASRTGEASSDLADFQHRFRDRLEALARVQGLLSRLNETDRIAFDELIQSEIIAMNGAAERVMLDGPRGIKLRSSMVQTLAMALHELATNAVKYGALGQPGAHLSIQWRMEAPDRQGRPRLHIDWRESGVAMPPIGAAPQGGGQGRELIEEALPYQLDAETSFEFEPDGVHCTITIPVSAINMAETI